MNTWDLLKEARTTNNQERINFFLQHNDVIFKKELSKNPNIDINVMEKLSKEPYNVQLKLLENPNITIDIVEKISEHTTDNDVRKKILNQSLINKNILDNILINSSVKLELASLKTTSSTQLDYLSNSKNFQILNTIVDNPNVNVEILKKIFHNNYIIAETGFKKEDYKKFPTISENFSTKEKDDLRLKIIQHKLITEDVFQDIVQETNFKLREKFFQAADSKFLNIQKVKFIDDNSVLLEVLDDYVDKDTNTNNFFRN